MFQVNILRCGKNGMGKKKPALYFGGSEFGFFGVYLLQVGIRLS